MIFRRLVLLLFTAATPLLSQSVLRFDSSNYRIGIVGSGNLTQHETSFGALPLIPNCCVEFTGVTQPGFTIGALADYRYSALTHVELRAGFTQANATLKEEDKIGNAIIGNQAVPVYVEHSIDAKLSMMGVMLLFKFEPLSFPLQFIIGGEADALMNKTFYQKEELIRPAGITFTNGSTIRNEFSGDIPKVNRIQSSAVAGVGLEIPIFLRWTIAPEAFVTYPLTRIARGLDWRLMMLRAGIAIRFQPIREILPPPIVPPPPPPKRTFINASLSAKVRSESASASEADRIVVDEVKYTEQFPLLPFVFFPEGIAVLPQTHQHLLRRDSTQSFSETSLRPKTEIIYSEMLNIIGQRLRNHPESRIHVVGCNNGINEELNNLTLSTQRADALKEYFTSVWEIAPHRISTSAQQLPSMPTKNDIPEGQEENRRAEISSDDPEILAPVRIEEIKRIAATPIIDFVPTIASSSAITSWSFTLTQGTRTLATETGVGDAPESIVQKIDAHVPWISSDSLRADLALTNVDGIRTRANTALPVRINNVTTQRHEQRHNMRIERYGLILFDFDKATLSSANARILDRVKKNISPDARVLIRGYADRTGSSDYNKRLAGMRCASVREYLGAAVRDDQIFLEPIGSDILIFDNETPEGRCYNRIVYITIETPEEH